MIFQGIANSLLWLSLSRLGNPSPSKRKKERTGDNSKLADARQDISLIDDILPSMLNRQAVFMNTLINAVLVLF